MSLPAKEACDVALADFAMYGLFDTPEHHESALLSLARLGARVAYPSEETVNAIARTIYYPFAEPYKPQGPGDSGVAVFQPMPDWCVERARDALTSLQDADDGK